MSLRDTHAFKVLGRKIAEAARLKAEHHARCYTNLRAEHAETTAKNGTTVWTRGKWQAQLDEVADKAERHRMLSDELMVEVKLYGDHNDTMFELDAEDVRYFGLVPYEGEV